MDGPIYHHLSFAASIIAGVTLMLMADRFKRARQESLVKGEGIPRSRYKQKLFLRQFVLTIAALVSIVFAMWLLFTLLSGKATGIFPFLCFDR
jgi:hypothetical protein